MKSFSFEPIKSHNILTGICDISNNPTVIHEIWKKFLEGTVLDRGIVEDPFALLAEKVDKMPWWELISFTCLSYNKYR